MDRSEIIYLYSPTTTLDSRGVTTRTYEKRQVFCQVLSVSRSEFFDAGRNGMNPEFEFVMFFGDYHGETLCEYRGKTYAIYRTYQRRDDNIELYVQREGGTNGRSE